MKINPTTTPAIPHAHNSPAKAARELLKSRPDLANQPFGQIVSKLARGEEIAAPESTTTDTPPPAPPQIEVLAPEVTPTDTPPPAPAQIVDVSV